MNVNFLEDSLYSFLYSQKITPIIKVQIGNELGMKVV